MIPVVASTKWAIFWVFYITLRHHRHCHYHSMSQRIRKQHARGPNGEEVAASGVVFFDPATGHALFQKEDMKTRGGEWTPALAMIGGKLGPGDRSILAGAKREVLEETGASSVPAIGALVGRMLLSLSDGSPVVCFYVKESKYLVFVATAGVADMELLSLEYAEAFGGKTSADPITGTKGDYTRAATHLVVANLSKGGVTLPCGARPLPHKVELLGFLREWSLRAD